MLDDDDFNEFDRKTPVQRFLVPAVGIFLVVGAGALGFTLIHGSHTPAARPHVEPHITQVQLPPPPPPPPPPKVQPPEPKKEVETTRPREPIPAKPVSMPAPKAPAPPNRVETSIAGPGAGSLGVGNSGGGDCLGQGCGNGDGPGGGDNDAYYANLVKLQIQEILHRDEKLRFARYKITVALTLDAGGHVARATISSFTGDDDIEAAVARDLKEISTGDAPPAAIVAKQFSVRITERAPG
jgi:hypothetical protein